MKHLISKSPAATEKIGIRLGKSLEKQVICLYGDIGAGKTTLVRGIAKGLQVKSKVRSPTFIYERIYSGRLPLYHFDYYRIEKADTLLATELLDVIQKNDGVVVIEWASKVEDFLPAMRTDIFINFSRGDKREILIKSYD